MSKPRLKSAAVVCERLFNSRLPFYGGFFVRHMEIDSLLFVLLNLFYLFIPMIVFGSKTSLRVFGILLIAGSLIKGLELLPAFSYYDEAYITLSDGFTSTLWDLAVIQDNQKEALLGISSQHYSFTDGLVPKIQAFNSEWENNIAYIAYDLMDNIFSESLIGYTCGFICLRLSTFVEEDEESFLNKLRTSSIVSKYIGSKTTFKLTLVLSTLLIMLLLYVYLAFNPDLVVPLFMRNYVY